jgi:CHAD domain-containing protein
MVRRTGQALGVVRELDTLIALCDQLERLHPAAAGRLATCRAQLSDERGRAARQLVKRVERFDLQLLRDQLAGNSGRFPEEVRDWKSALGDRIESRASRLSSAVERASGVYLPNRLHKVRIHLKKLRYLVEIAERSEIWRPAHWRRDARKLQEMLGEIHDRQVLLERLEPAADGSRLHMTLRADIAQRHRRYLERRERLRAMVDACQRFAVRISDTRVPFARSLAMAALIPVVSLAITGHRPHRSYPPARIA